MGEVVVVDRPWAPIGPIRRRWLAQSAAILWKVENFIFTSCQNRRVRSTAAAVAALLVAGVLTAAPAAAGPTSCDEPSCVPGIQGGVALGAFCDNTTYYVFGTTSQGPIGILPGRILFCGSPRRYAPRWYRSPKLVGIKELGADCIPYLNMVAQAPDGLFLTCVAQNGRTLWVRGDA